MTLAMKKNILVYLFVVTNIILLLGVLLGYSEFSWIDDLLAGVFFLVLGGCILSMKISGKATLRKWATGVFLLSLGFLVSRPLMSVSYWWNAHSTVLVMAAVLLIGLATFGISLVLGAERAMLVYKPADRDESTHNFLYLVMIGTLLVALAASFITALFSGNYSLTFFSTFTTLFSLLVLGIGWLRFAPHLGNRLMGSVRVAGTAALLVLAAAGLFRSMTVSTAYADAEDALGKNNLPGAKKMFLLVAANKKRPGLQDKSRLELAKIALAEGRLVEAIKYLEEIAGAPKEEIEAVKIRIAKKLLGSAWSLQKENKSGKAEDAVYKAVKLAPFSAEVLTESGKILSLNKKTKEALRLFERATRADSGYAPAWRWQLEILLALGRDEDAARIVERFPGVKIKDNDARLRLGRELFFLGDHQRAKAVLLVFSRSKDAEALYWLARSCDALDDFRKARPLYEKAAELDGKYADGCYRIGAHLEKTGDKTGAVDLYKKVLGKAPEHAGALIAKARLEEAKDTFEGYTKFEAVGSSGISGWYRLSPTSWNAGEKLTLETSIILVQDGVAADAGYCIELRWPFRKETISYNIPITGLVLKNKAIGEYARAEKSVEIPGLPPGLFDVCLKTGRDEDVSLCSLKLTLNGKYRRTEAGPEDMIGIYAWNKKFFYHKEFKLGAHGWVFFPLYASEGPSILSLTLHGTESKGELPKIAVCANGIEIFREFINSSESHKLDIPFSSKNEVIWFDVFFINHYWNKAQKKGRHLFIENARIYQK
jgi:tetratricopeptide (TPR) repeat protein